MSHNRRLLTTPVPSCHAARRRMRDLRSAASSLRLEAEARACRILAEELARAAQRFPEVAARLPPVELAVSGRMTLALATARCFRRDGKSLAPRITISRLALLALGPERLRDTLIHEVAHVYADAMAGSRQCHGARWRGVASALGIQPRRLASPDESREIQEFKARHGPPLRRRRRRRRSLLAAVLADGFRGLRRPAANTRP